MALLIVGSAILLFSCESQKPVQEESPELIMTEKSDTLTVIVSENGRRSYRFYTPLLEGYTLGREPYREFRKGIKIITYQDDSMCSVNATLVAQYAIYYEKRKLWEAKGNVRINKADGTKLFTQQLFWDSSIKKIYSNVDTKVETTTDTYFAEGFESDEELIEMRFRYWKGKMQFDQTELNKQRDSIPADSTKTTKPATKSNTDNLTPKQRAEQSSRRESVQSGRNSSKRNLSQPMLPSAATTNAKETPPKEIKPQQQMNVMSGRSSDEAAPIIDQPDN